MSDGIAMPGPSRRLPQPGGRLPPGAGTIMSRAGKQLLRLSEIDKLMMIVTFVKTRETIQLGKRCLQSQTTISMCELK